MSSSKWEEARTAYNNGMWTVQASWEKSCLSSDTHKLMLTERSGMRMHSREQVQTLCRLLQRKPSQGEVLKGQCGRDAESKGWQRADKFRQEPIIQVVIKVCLFVRTKGRQQRILPGGGFTRERSSWQSSRGQETRQGTVSFLPHSGRDKGRGFDGSYYYDPEKVRQIIFISVSVNCLCLWSKQQKKWTNPTSLSCVSVPLRQVTGFRHN